jgi:hypothetical protein
MCNRVMRMLIVLILPSGSPLPAAPPDDVAAKSVVWELNQLDRLGSHPVTVAGSPRLIDIPGG